MASTFSNLGFELQTTGENANTWGDKTNVNLELIDERLSAIGTITDLKYSKNIEIKNMLRNNDQFSIIYSKNSNCINK